MPFSFEGFGANATGGYQSGGDVYYVTSLADNGAGTLREGLTTGNAPRVVQFQVDGTITLDTEIALPSHVAIDGRGHQITITHKGFNITNQENVIIVNLKFYQISGPGDAIMINNSHDVVIDHCLFDNEGLAQGDSGSDPNFPDEFISVIWGSYNVTISWNKLINNALGVLVGNGDAPQTVDAQITVTQHHNYFYNISAYHPHLQYGKADIYNNYFKHWKLHYSGFGVALYCIRNNNGQAIIEQNRFEQYYDQGLTYTLYNARALIVENGGKANSINNSVEKTWDPVNSYSPGDVFARPYPATIEEVNSSWLQMIEAQTGNVL